MIILIADDEKLIRFTMKSMLNDILGSDCTYIEAANGHEFVKLCQKSMPDIAFVDIKMPYMDGITAIAECQKFSPTTEFVVISGYSDFEYAKKCIPLNITEYLLKPVEEEKLAEIIKILEKKLEYVKNQSNSRFQLLLINSFNYLFTFGKDSEYAEPRLDTAESYYVFGTYIKYSKKKHILYNELQKTFINSVNKFGNTINKQHSNYCLIYSNDGTPYFIFKAFKRYETSIIKQMQRICSLINTNGLTISLIYFKENHLSNIYDICEHLDETYYICMNYPNKSIIEYNTNTITSAQREILLLINQLLIAYIDADEVVYTDRMNKLWNYPMSIDVTVKLKYIANYIECITGYEVQSSNFKCFCKSLVNMGTTIYKNIEKPDNDIIEQIKTYIGKNYMYNISINQISDRFNLTPNYVSTIFHKRVGCKFMDYLTDIRISDAKRLLIKNNTASVKDIAIMVGYMNPRHFSTLFQKSTGITPTAYRKVHGL